MQRRPDMVLLDAAILMNPQVWVASGHVGGFSDPLIDCKACKTRHRADKLIEEKYKKDLFSVIKDLFYQQKINALYEKIRSTFPEKLTKTRLPLEDKLLDLEKKW